jgi:hypothetical protein
MASSRVRVGDSALAGDAAAVQPAVRRSTLGAQMPKEWAMAQLKLIPRPLQIALVATIVLFAVWLVVLRGHSSSGESSSPPASSAQPASSARAPAPGAPSSSSKASPSGSSTYHGSAPGVAGLTRAIAKARGAAAASERNTRALQQKEAQAGGGPTHTPSTGAHPSSAAASASPPARAAPAKTAPAKGAPSAASKHPSTSTSSARARAGSPVMQPRVEAELEHGQLVAILLWNPKGAVDKVVRRELQAARHAFGARLAVHAARSSQVGSFGTFTRAVQVLGTPTILLINRRGATSSVTGLNDAFSIEQAIREAQRAR